MQNYRPAGFINPFFYPKNLFKIGFLTFSVVLEPLKPEFDSDFLSVYSYMSQKLMCKVTYQPDLKNPFFYPKNNFKISFWTFLVVLEPFKPEFDSDFLSVYFNRSQKLMLQVTDQPDLKNPFFFPKTSLKLVF